jgi:hypothetical protein
MLLRTVQQVLSRDSTSRTMMPDMSFAESLASMHALLMRQAYLQTQNSDSSAVEVEGRKDGIDTNEGRL